LDELSRSGMSAAKFVQSKGVSMQRVVYWRKRLSQPEGPAFVAMPLARRAASRPERSQMEIESGSVVVRVREDLDAEHLSQILRVLAQQTRC
jgi:hypothetical protein